MVDIIVVEDSGGRGLLLTMAKLPETGNVTLWIGHKSYALSSASYDSSLNDYTWSDIDNKDSTDLDWEEDDEVRVALVYERALPSAPTNVNVTAPPGEDGTLAVSWEAPDVGGTFPIEYYLVEFRPVGDARRFVRSHVPVGETSVRRTDLERGVEYRALVQALSGDGYGDPETRTIRTRGRALRAQFVTPPERHDGKKRVKVRAALSEPVDETPQNVGEHGVDVEGGEVTSARKVGGNAPGGAGTRSNTRSVGSRNAGQEDREVVWEFEIEPDSDGDVTVSLDAGRPCDEPGAICTADGRSLSEGISTTVEGPETGPAGLTAAFEGMPETHDGEGAFSFRVAFSEDIGISFQSLREDAFTVTGGRVTGGKRVDDRRDLFEMTVEPDADGDVTITLPAGRECGASGAICTKGENRRQLTNSPSATVAGPSEDVREPNTVTGRRADDWRDGAGRGGTDRLDVGHHRRRRAGQRELRLPVDPHGRRHWRGDRLHLHGGGGRRGQDPQGPGQLHRRRRQRGEPHQRGDRCGRCTAGRYAGAEHADDGVGVGFADGSADGLGVGRSGARGAGRDAGLRGDAERGIAGHGDGAGRRP